MSKENVSPLGYIELPNGSKPIYPMNDIFLNYTFEVPEHWDALRDAVNIFTEAYAEIKPDTAIKPIKGNIKMRTQFRHILKTDGKTTRDQDLKMTEDEEDATYVEFQNDAITKPPIEVRSVVYFGLGIGHGKGNLANQIWLLAEDVESVLHEEKFTRYVLKDEVTGKSHPTTSGIMYISLTRLSKEKTAAGELASFLLGKIKTPENETVRKIAQVFNESFTSFREDKHSCNE